MSDEKESTDPQTPEPQAGDGKSHPESLSDPPKPAPDTNALNLQEVGGPIDPAAIAALAPLGYDVLEPKPEAVLLCARLCHAVVEAMNAAFNENTLPWEVSGPSYIAGVERVLANPGESAEDNHNAWMEYKRKEGWIYGTNKDPVALTHPCMLPYQALGPFAQSKDAVFHAIVRTFFGVK